MPKGQMMWWRWPPESETARSLSFHLVFGSRRSDRLPLHVRGHILSTLGQRRDVIDDVAGAAVRIAALLHEVSFRDFAALDFTVRVTRTALALGRRRLRARDLALRLGLCLRLALVARAWGVRLRPNAAGCRLGMGMNVARTSAVRNAGMMTAVVATTMASAVTASAVATTVPAAATTTRYGH